MELKPYDLRDPALVVEALAKRYRLTRPAAYLAVVRDPSTAQKIVSVEKLRTPAVIDDWQAASDELRERLNSADIPTAGPPGSTAPSHLPMLIVVRPGRCVSSPNERVWWLAQRYMNSMAWTWSPGLMVVTEHGWYDFTTKWGAVEPALRPRSSSASDSPRTLRVV